MTAFAEEMRSLERDIASQRGSGSSAILAALDKLPAGSLIEIRDGRCEVIPNGNPRSHRATELSAQPTRSKSARVAHLQRRARTMLVLSGDGALVARSQPVVDEHEAAEYIPADFNPPH
jgi:hypothetical protein